MHSWHRHVHPGNYGRADPDYSVLALWNGMSGHRLTEKAGPSVWAVYPRQGACVGPVGSWRWALRRKDMSRPLPTTHPAMGKWRSGKTAP